MRYVTAWNPVSRAATGIGLVGMEQRGEQLNVSAPDRELPLAAAVRADVVRLAVLVCGEEALDRAEA